MAECCRQGEIFMLADQTRLAERKQVLIPTGQPWSGEEGEPKIVLESFRIGVPGEEPATGSRCEPLHASLLLQLPLQLFFPAVYIQ